MGVGIHNIPTFLFYHIPKSVLPPHFRLISELTDVSLYLLPLIRKIAVHDHRGEHVIYFYHQPPNTLHELVTVRLIAVLLVRLLRGYIAIIQGIDIVIVSPI